MEEITETTPKKKRQKNSRPCVFTKMRNGQIYRYYVKVTINQKRYYVGCYKTAEEAEKGRDGFLANPPVAEVKKFDYEMLF